jgi:5-methylcytosine-specific restriction endonuclease McrA
LEVHHVVPKAEGGVDTIDNLATLCESCDGRAHRG